MARMSLVKLPLIIVTLSLIIFSAVSVYAGPVDLNTWTAESYPAVSGFGAGAWTVTPGGDAVTQSVNGQPTFFYSDFTSFNTEVTGTIRSGGSDDDYIGFALGFLPGDSSNASADYLLIDWKKGTQSYNFGAPSSTPGSKALAGLAISRVTGIPTADEFWGHTDFTTDPAGGLNELARGNTLGNVGWASSTDYNFDFVFQPTRLQVFVNNTLEMDITGSFSNGRMAFYNFSQAGVTYSAFEAVNVVPEPISSTLFILGGAVLGFRHFRKKRN